MAIKTTKSVTTSFIDFINSVDDIAHNKSKTIKQIVESSLKIEQDDIENLYILKYYIEQECQQEMDSCLQFISSLISVYSKGANFKMNSLTSIVDLVETSSNLSARLRGLHKSIIQNSGVIPRGVSEAVFDGNQFIFTRKEVVLDEDGSICYQPESSLDLDIFEHEIFKQYSYKFSRERSNNIKQSFDKFRSAKLFDNSCNDLLCISSVTSPTSVTGTVFDLHFSLDDIDTTQPIMENTEFERKGMSFTLWIV